MQIKGPRHTHSDEKRRADDAWLRPHVEFHNPDDLHFPNKMLPPVPGDGGQITAGLNMVVYDHQPLFDRLCDMAGPVKRFFAGVVYDQRIRHS